MILLSELGDKTFFLAAVLSMRATHRNKLKIFFGSILALIFMSFLSVFLGVFIFTWVPMLYTQVASACLFFLFSLLMIREAMADKSSITQDSSLSIEGESTDSMSCNSILFSPEPSIHPVTFYFSKSFILTLVAEWGDRSQLATIALATTKNLYGVLIGTIFGHLLCTGIAVLCGSYISKYLSLRRVTLMGALLFFIFFIATIIEITLQAD